MGANAKAKANAATAIPELNRIASNPAFEENRKEKHNKNAKYGWYRYDVRFALPVYEENVLVRYNIFHAEELEVFHKVLSMMRQNAQKITNELGTH